MEFKETVGIDVSKKTLDVHIHKEKMYREYDNNPKDIKKMVGWVFSNTECTKDEVLFVFEHTGMYSDQTMSVLSQKGVRFSVVSGLEIKRSMGLGKGQERQNGCRDDCTLWLPSPGGDQAYPNASTRPAIT